MKEVNILEETLNGGYHGLYGEVVTCDTYRLKQLQFVPDIIFDVGANVGIFSRYARTLFPKALIVALEPHPENLLYFCKFTKDSNLILIPKALGRGVIFRCTGAANGAGESYLSAGLGFTAQEIVNAPNVRSTTVGPITLSTFILPYLKPGMKSLLKVDCEGGENSIWGDSKSMQVLWRMDYICMELHDYSLSGAGRIKVQSATAAGLSCLESTHTCERDGVYFWAAKKL
jgi:FkbM family methyltransferase